MNIGIEKLIIADYNPRVPVKPGTRTYEDLKASIQKFGIADPIIVNKDMTVIGGHQRLIVARDLGLTEVPCFILDLNKDDEKVLNVALNKIVGKWDEDKLKALIEGLKAKEYDTKFTGFNDNEIKKYTGITTEPEKPPAVSDWDVKRGDKFKVGRHFVMCGDSGNAEDVSKLLDGVKIDCMVCDPPFGVDYGDKAAAIQKSIKRGRKHDDAAITNDKGLDYLDFFTKFLSLTPWADYNTAYIFMSGSNLMTLHSAFVASGGTWGDYLIWLKNHAVMNRKDYNAKHEFVFYGWHGKHKFYGPTNACAFLEYKHNNVSHLHPHQKPIDLLARLISDGAAESGVIYDPFGGSGSVLIAAEQMGRVSYTMELEPNYVEVILNRAKGQGCEINAC